MQRPKMQIKRPELLSPAGDSERLDAALLYGADAVYLGSDMFSMRAATPNFEGEDLENAVQKCGEDLNDAVTVLNTTIADNKTAVIFLIL